MGDRTRGSGWGRMPAVHFSPEGANHQVPDLAQAVAAALPGTSASINRAAPPDSRSYRVDFSVFRELAPNHQPLYSLGDSISSLVSGLRSIDFDNADFRRSASLIRLNALSSLIEQGTLDADMRWCGRSA